MKQKNNKSKFRAQIAMTKYFSTEQKCKDYLAEQRWHGKPVCPYCGCETVYHRKDGRYACKDCEKTFSVLVGTIFQNTKLKLIQWFTAIYLIVNNKQGISSAQLAREIEVTQNTAWHVLQKIRILLHNKDDGFPDTLTEIITNLSDTSKKQLKVVQLKEPPMLHPKILPFVKPNSRIFSDKYICYQTLAESELEKYQTEDPHGTHTNPRNGKLVSQGVANGLWLQIKRMIMGIYHYVSASFFHRYVFEALFRQLTCHETNTNRFERVLGRIYRVVPYKIISPKHTT